MASARAGCVGALRQAEWPPMPKNIFDLLHSTAKARSFRATQRGRGTALRAIGLVPARSRLLLPAPRAKWRGAKVASNTSTE